MPADNHFANVSNPSWGCLCCPTCLWSAIKGWYSPLQAFYLFGLSFSALHFERLRSGFCLVEHITCSALHQYHSAISYLQMTSHHSSTRASNGSSTMYVLMSIYHHRKPSLLHSLTKFIRTVSNQPQNHALLPRHKTSKHTHRQTVYIKISRSVKVIKDPTHTPSSASKLIRRSRCHHTNTLHRKKACKTTPSAWVHVFSNSMPYITGNESCLGRKDTCVGERP